MRRVLPLATTAEELQVRSWTGNFYVLVPVRVDWMHEQWGEAEECYELAEGTLRERLHDACGSDARARIC